MIVEWIELSVVTNLWIYVYNLLSLTHIGQAQILIIPIFQALTRLELHWEEVSCELLAFLPTPVLKRTEQDTVYY